MKKILLATLLSIGVVSSMNAGNMEDFNEYTKSCKNGNQKDCKLLGDMYLKGQGVEKNIDKALDIYLESCDKKGASSCRLVGYIALDDGDIEAATAYLMEACKLKDTESCAFIDKARKASKR